VPGAAAGGGAELPPPGVLCGRAFSASLDAPLARETLTVSMRVGATGSSRRTVVTGDGGEFRLEGLAPGYYNLTFSHAEHVALARRVTVPPARGVEPLELVFARGLSAWGVVTDLDERPAPEVAVEWRRSEASAVAASAVTDAAGEYRVGGLERGVYLVRVVPERLRALWVDEAPYRQVSVRDGEAVRLDFTSDVGARLRIIVEDADGGAVSGLEVAYRVRTERHGVSGFTAGTDAGGATFLEGLPRAGSLSLEASRAESGSARLELDLAELPPSCRLRLASPP
jgi:hypothetical protein